MNHKSIFESTTIGYFLIVPMNIAIDLNVKIG